jgi:hypothetical protein
MKKRIRIYRRSDTVFIAILMILGLIIMIIGCNIRVPADSSQFYGGGINYIVLTFILGGLIFLVGFVPLCLRYRRKKLENALVADGRRVMADFQGVSNEEENCDIIYRSMGKFHNPYNKCYSSRPDYSDYNDNSKGDYSTYSIICEWTDERGNIHVFKSCRLFEFPDLKNVKQLDVYLDPNDYSKYYVDVGTI